MKNRDLLPCPFCGGTAKFRQDCYEFWLVQCGECGIGTQHRGNKRDALREWNRRSGITNADRIRNMRDRELQKFIEHVYVTGWDHGSFIWHEDWVKEDSNG